MDLGSDSIRDLLMDEDSDNESAIDLFGGDDTDEDPDFVVDESEFTDEEDADENAEQEPPQKEGEQPQPETASGHGILSASVVLTRVRNVAARVGRNGHLWSVQQPERRGRVLERNLIVHLPGAKGPAKNVSSPFEAWNLLIDNSILDEILNRTNEEIKRKVENINIKQSYHKDINKDELLAFFGLLYISGVKKFSHTNLEELWSIAFGTSIFRTTMSMNRFKFIGCCLRFDDKTTRAERKSTDKFAPIRNIWESFVENARSLYSPAEYVTIDEQLLGFRGRCPFRVYMRNKPDKYGLKVVMMNDAKTFYMLNATPYAGKFKPPNKEPVPSYYVRTLSEPIHGSNRNITVDNWFSSIPLFEKMLMDYKLTMVGTLRSNKPEIPPSFTAKKAEGASIFAFDSNKMLVSYSPRTNKNVLILSSMHQSKEVDEGTNKPEVILFYNSTKGGTDSFDQLCHSYTVSRKCNRWPLRMWYGMMDQSGINAMVLYNLRQQNPKMKRRKFLMELSLSMIKPFLQSKLQVSTLRRSLRISICEILGQNALQPGIRQDVGPVLQRRCSFCPRTRDRKTKTRCTICQRYTCDEHRVKLCYECED